MFGTTSVTYVLTTPPHPLGHWPQTTDKSLVIRTILPRRIPELETYGRIDTIFLFDEFL